MHYPKTELNSVGGWGETNLHPSKQKKIMTKKTHSGSKEGWPSYAVMWALYRSPPPFKICDPEPVYSMRYNGRS